MAAIHVKDDMLTFADVSQEADYHDTWLFASARRYQHINMYEAEKSISAAEWHGAECKCVVVGTSEAFNNELLLYTLPAIDKTDGLSKYRELSIVAAACSAGPCHSLASAPPTFMDPSMIARTEQGSAKLFIHSLKNEISDSTISNLQLLHTFDPFSQTSQSPTVQLTGTSNIVSSVSLHELLWYDITTQKQVAALCYDDILKETVSKLMCADDNTCIVSGATTGNTILTDKRSSHTYTTLLTPVNDKGVRWSLCGTREHDVIRLSDNNELSVGDTRKPGIIKCQCALEAPIRTRRNTPFTTHINGHVLSLSGKDNKVRLYNLEIVEDSKVVEPIFTHDGHLPDVEGGDMPNITTHSWSSSTSPLLASASDTGQLHIWSYDKG